MGRTSRKRETRIFSKEFIAPDYKQGISKLYAKIRRIAAFYGFQPVIVTKAYQMKHRYFVSITGRWAGKFIVYDTEEFTVTGYGLKLTGLTHDGTIFDKFDNSCHDGYERFQTWILRINNAAGNDELVFPPASFISELMDISTARAGWWTGKMKQEFDLL